MLPTLGYSLVTKPLKEITNGDEIKKKGNMDVEIVLDMFNTIDTYDMAVLLSGDSDFERPLMQLRARGKRFAVVSHRAAVAREILAVAGMHFLDISTIERYVSLSYSDRSFQGYSDSQYMYVPTTSEELHTG
jgi:uncharacterized LabA/DUF88 family protein